MSRKHFSQDLVESLWLVSGSLVQGDWARTREALVRARARRGWSEGAGAHRTRVNWEQVEDRHTRTLPCTGRARSCLHHTLHYGGWRNQLIASIPSNRHEPMNSARKNDGHYSLLLNSSSKFLSSFDNSDLKIDDWGLKGIVKDQETYNKEPATTQGTLVNLLVRLA